MGIQSIAPVTLAVLKGRPEQIACGLAPEFSLQVAQIGGRIASLKQGLAQGSEKPNG